MGSYSVLVALDIFGGLWPIGPCLFPRKAGIEMEIDIIISFNLMPNMSGVNPVPAHIWAVSLPSCRLHDDDLRNTDHTLSDAQKELAGCYDNGIPMWNQQSLLRLLRLEAILHREAHFHSGYKSVTYLLRNKVFRVVSVKASVHIPSIWRPTRDSYAAWRCIGHADGMPSLISSSDERNRGTALCHVERDSFTAMLSQLFSSSKRE